MTARVEPGRRARGARSSRLGDAMVDELLRYLESGETAIAYVALAVAAILEYVFPPFPGDTVTLFGTFLAATRGYSPPLVFATITSASTVGGLLPWALGRWLHGNPERWPAFLRGERTSRALARVRGGFERYGRWYLVGNRFVPAVRAFVLLGAGLGGIPLGAVLLYGGISAILWNGLLFGIGFSVGRSWEQLQSISETYSWAALGVLLAVASVVWLRWRLRR